MIVAGSSSTKTGSRTNDLTGMVVGRVRVIGIACFHGTKTRTKWKCVCSCGTEFESRADSIVAGTTASCGCSRSKHGLGRPPELFVWEGMKARCFNSNSPQWKNYGGRGISICSRWMDFGSFYRDMGPRPSRLHSIDRIDTNKDYEPSNCRWSTSIEQGRNRRDNVLMSMNGKTQCLAAWASDLGIPYSCLYYRVVTAGLPHEVALTKSRRSRSDKS